MTLWQKCLTLALLLVLLAACQNAAGETAVTPIPPTPTQPASPANQTPDAASATGATNFFVIATDAPNEPYASFNRFGEIEGLIPDLFANLATAAQFEYEFVATPYEGALNSLGRDVNRDFDAVISPYLFAGMELPAGVTLTVPYLQVGQVLLTLADRRDLTSYSDLRPGMTLGAQAFSSGYEAARTVLGLSESDIFTYPSTRSAIEALVDESITAVVLDHFSAEQFALAYPEQVKIVGGAGEAAWLSHKAYSIAVPQSSTAWLQRLNEAITAVQTDGRLTESVLAWLVPNVADIDAGESRVGTPPTELIIGIVGDLTDMEPAGAPNLISWEIKHNTMSGLYRFTAENELLPALALDFPAISEDGLEYIIRLQPDLRFPDGSEFSAEDVKWSLDRATVTGSASFLLNAFLKDANNDGFADTDAVQVLDRYTVKLVLQEPLGYFPSLLATPPYFIVSNECYAEGVDPQSVCGGIGPYTIVSWEPGERIRLQANPDWPGEPPRFANLQVRFYASAAQMMRSLTEFQSIDIAWTGLPYGEFVALPGQDMDGDGRAEFVAWQGPSAFKSYLIFDHATPPWDDPRVRLAAAYAVNREVLASTIFGGSRLPLYSPVPDGVPGHVAVLPRRDLARARALLLEAGYSENQPLPITIWYLNDGRYSNLEAAYATAIREQLEESDLFQVTLSAAPWELFQAQIFTCGYPAYLVGWPTPGAPVNYLDATSWTDFFIENTDRGFCSNYESESMADLSAAAQAESDMAVRLELYRQIQELWATELPTLDLTQEPRRLLSLSKVEGVQIDALGLLHYDRLTKTGE